MWHASSHSHTIRTAHVVSFFYRRVTIIHQQSTRAQIPKFIDKLVRDNMTVLKLLSTKRARVRSFPIPVYNSYSITLFFASLARSERLRTD